MTLPKHVTIVEVSPRDGLQNEMTILPTPIKVDFIHRLATTGLKVIEATSFVSPKWVPQLADHRQVMQEVKRQTGIAYPVLVPNTKGMEAAIESGVKEIAVFTTTSETFSKKNANCSLAESINRIRDIIAMANVHHVSVRGYISCITACPYEGVIAINQTVKVTKQLIDLGCEQVSLGDTMGVATAGEVHQLLEALLLQVSPEQIAVHFHDTYGQALANIYVSLEYGIATIDSSVAGLGGCPYSPGASGNVATEDVLYMLNGLGIETGVDLHQLIKIGRFICQQLGQKVRSKVSQASQ